MKKFYKYKTYTQDHRLGDVVEYATESERVKQLLKKGFIVETEKPKVAEPKETKVVEVEETKSSKKAKEA